ncbi:MAG: ankyrin repeat domain-containing protein, partial [Acidobacteriota bacterium]
MKPSKLEAAIRAGDLEKVRELIAKEVDVSLAFADGTKPIQLAAREGQVTIVRALAAAGADLDDLEVLSLPERLKLFVESSLDTPTDEDLLSATELSTWAMQAVGAQMDEKTATEIAASEGDIFRAVRTGDVDLLRQRLAAGDPVDPVREITRDTPLTLAVQGGEETMIRELIAAGANIDHSGYLTPLTFSLPNLRLAKILVEAGADLYASGLDRQTVLDRAVHRALQPTSSLDSLLLVRFFLEAGVHPPNVESVPGELLLEAEYAKAWEVYHDLLPHYPDEVARDSFSEVEERRDSQTRDGGFGHWAGGLRYAAQQGDVEETRQALASCPDLSHADLAHELGLALRDAVSVLHLDVARELIAAGAALDAVSFERRRGWSPLTCAAESWHRQSIEAMQLLLDAGAGVDAPGPSGRTPLMFAVLLAYRHGAPLRKALPLLLAAGADCNQRDELGLTAWTLAKAPLVEAEERVRRGGDAANNESSLFDGPDLSELFSDSANQADQRRGRLERCRQVVAKLEEAGAEACAESELRLVLAAAAGDAARVEELLAAGAGPDGCGPDGRTAIESAAAAGSLESVERLIAAGCDVDARRPAEPSALELAVRQCDLPMTRCLLDAGANAVMLAAFSNGALAAAEAAGGGEVVALIRQALPPELAYVDREVEQEIADEDLSWQSQNDLPHYAALGDLETVRRLLAVQDVDVNGFDPLRRTPLAAAAEAGQIEVVRELLACGADVDRCNGVIGSPRSMPLACAAISPSAERDQVLQLLLDAGANVDQLGADGRTALMHAAERDVGFFGRTGVLGLSTHTLLAAGADPEIRDPYDLTAWMRVHSLASSIEIDEVAEHYEKIAQQLEEAGASTVGLPEVELLWAIVTGEAGRVRELLAAGASPDARAHDGSTALMLAVRDDLPEIVELLIDAGCDTGAQQWLDRGPTALDA